MPSVITARIDASDKKAFDEFCKSVGMNASTAINMFVKATLRANKFPFEIDVDPFYSAKNQALLKKNIDEMEKRAKSLKNDKWGY